MSLRTTSHINRPIGYAKIGGIPVNQRLNMLVAVSVDYEMMYGGAGETNS